MKHWCGCVTEDFRDGIRFKKMCRRHETERSFIWVAIQHGTKQKRTLREVITKVTKPLWMPILTVVTLFSIFIENLTDELMET